MPLTSFRRASVGSRKSQDGPSREASTKKSNAPSDRLPELPSTTSSTPIALNNEDLTALPLPIELPTTAPTPQHTAAEITRADSALKTGTSEDAVEDIRAGEKSRPQSPSQLNLFPKRLPVRVMVKSMEGPMASASSEARSMTPSPRPTTPAADQQFERQLAAEAAEVLLPPTTPIPSPQPTLEKQDRSMKSPATDPNLLSPASKANSQTAPTMMARAAEALAAAKGALPDQEGDPKESQISPLSKAESFKADRPTSGGPASDEKAKDRMRQAQKISDNATAARKITEPVGGITLIPPSLSKSSLSRSKDQSLPSLTRESPEISIQDHTPDAKPQSQTLTVQDLPLGYLSELPEPPNSPLPHIPNGKSSEQSKSQSQPTQEVGSRLSRQSSTDSVSKNAQSGTGRTPLLRATTPDIITRRTSRDRLTRNSTLSTGSSSHPSRQLSLKLPVNPSNGFSPSGRVSPSGRSPTPDLTRRVSHEHLSRSPTPGVGDRESVSSQRISINVPVHPHTTLSSRHSYKRAPTPDALVRVASRESLTGRDSPTPAEPLDFLAALAAQERLVLELRELQEQAELDLESLKKEWADQEEDKKEAALRQVEDLLRHLGHTQPFRNISVKDTDKKADEASQSRQDQPSEPSPPGEVKVRQRKVFKGGEMRPLSLLSPNETSSRASSPNPRSRSRLGDIDAPIEDKDERGPSPMPQSEYGLESPESEPDMEAEMEAEIKERSDALSIIQEEASTRAAESVKHDSIPPLPTDEAFMANSLQLASNLNEGLETFLKDLKKARVNEELPNPAVVEKKAPSLASEPLSKKKSQKREASRGKEEPLMSPVPELKKSGSLIKTTLIKGESSRHQSTSIDVDNEFFDSDLWKVDPSVKSPVALSPILAPKVESIPSAKPRRRYLNIESEETSAADATTTNTSSQEQSNRKETPTSSRETDSTWRRSASTDRSNPRSSTTSTHEENPKRASSPLLIEALPSPQPPSPTLESSKSDETVKPIRPTTMVTNLMGDMGPITAPPSKTEPVPALLVPSKNAPTLSSPKSVSTFTSPRTSRDTQSSPRPKADANAPRLLSPRTQDPPPVSRFSMEPTSKLKQTASDLMLTLGRTVNGPKSATTKKEKENRLQSERPSSPRFTALSPSSPHHTTLLSPLNREPLGMSPPTPQSVSKTGRNSIISTAASQRTNKDLPPLPPVKETPSMKKTVSTPGVTNRKIVDSSKKRNGFPPPWLKSLAPAKLGPKIKILLRRDDD